MAALRVTCPSCKTVLQVGEQSFGKAVRCPKCQTVLKIAAASPPAVAPPAAEQRPAVPPPAAVQTTVPTPPPSVAAFAPPVPAPAPAAPLPPLLSPPEGRKGAPLMPALAIGAAAVLATGMALAVGLYLITRMIGTENPTRTAGPAPSPPTEPQKADKDGAPPPPVAKNSIDTSFIPESAATAVVVRPKRMLASDVLAGLPQEELFGKLAAAGLDPRRVEQAVLYFDGAPADGKPQAGVILHLTEPVDAKKMVAAAAHAAKEVKIGDATCYVLEQPLPVLPPALCFPDDKTILGGEEAALKAMLAAGHGKSALLDRLRQADGDDDVLMISLSQGDRPRAAEALQSMLAAAPPELQEGTALDKDIQAASLTANVSKDPLLAIDVEAKDEKAAVEMLVFASNCRDYLHSHYDDLRKGFAIGVGGPDLLDGVAADLDKGFTATHDGSRVHVSLKRPAAAKDLATRLGPFLLRIIAALPNPNPAPQPTPAPAPAQDLLVLAPQWVRANEGDQFDTVIASTLTSLPHVVGPKDGGFILGFGAKLLKSKKPTWLVAWHGALVPLELTANEAKLTQLSDFACPIRLLPASDDLGPEPAVGQLSDLKIDSAEALDAAARLTGTVTFHRQRPDDPNEFFSIRLIIPAGNEVLTSYQRLDAPLATEGTLALGLPPDAVNNKWLNFPTVALVELVAYPDVGRQGKPHVASNVVMTLIVPK